MDIDTLNKKKSLPLLKKLKEFGYWPVLHGNKWDADKYNLTKLLAQVTQSRDTGTFFDFYIPLDPKNVSRRLLHFDQGGLGLGSSARDYYLNRTRYKKQLDAYERYINEKIILLSKDAGIPYDKKAIAKNVSEILDFEIKFAEILVPEDDRRNYTKMYNIRHFSNLSSLLDEVSNI